MLKKPLLGLGLALGLSSLAHAQQVLVLGTTESSAVDYPATIAAAYTAAGATVDYQAGALSSATAIDPTLFNGKDVVVVVGVRGAIQDVHLSVINSAMSNAPNDRLRSFVFFVDGCCDANGTHDTQNNHRLLPLLNAATGWNISHSRHFDNPGPTRVYLNTSSAYSSHFSGQSTLDPFLRGHDYARFSGAPAANTVYLHGDPASPTGAYSVFAPRAQVNGGAGTCVLYTGDASLMSFDSSYNVQRTQFAAASLSLAASDDCQPRNTVAVPTLGQWGLMLLGLAAAGLGARRLRRS